jgi:hypothetical protein
MGLARVQNRAMKRSLFALLVFALMGAACAAKASSGSPPPGASGIEGTVLVGPTCPVFRQGSPCPDTPVAAKLTVTDGSGVTITTAMSGADGRFKIALAAGTYIVKAERPGVTHFGQSGPVTVTVRSGAFTTLKVEIDSGIR